MNKKDEECIEKVKIKEEIFEEEEFEEDKIQEYNYAIKNKFWISDILNDLYELLNSYIKRDRRLKWVGIGNIMYGPRSYYKIKYDEDIEEFIDDFLNELSKIFDYMKRKQLEIKEENRLEFDILISLNKQIIYSRIAFCLGRWFV